MVCVLTIGGCRGALTCVFEWRVCDGGAERGSEVFFVQLTHTGGKESASAAILQCE